MALERSLEHVPHAELPAYLTRVSSLALVGEARVAGDHVEVTEAGKVCDDVVGDALGQVFVLGIAAQVRERENGERDPAGQGRQGTGRARDAGPTFGRGADRVDPNRALDVLQAAFTQGVEAVRQLAPDLVVDLAGDADGARLGQGLQAGGEVDTLAVDVAVLDDDIAEADADSEPNAFRLGSLTRVLGDICLDLDRAAYRLDDAGEFAKQPVAHELDQTASVLGQKGLDHLLATRLEPLQGAGLVVLHERGVADHVRRQDRRQAALSPRSRGVVPAGATSAARR